MDLAVCQVKILWTGALSSREWLCQSNQGKPVLLPRSEPRNPSHYFSNLGRNTQVLTQVTFEANDFHGANTAFATVTVALVVGLILFPVYLDGAFRAQLLLRKLRDVIFPAIIMARIAARDTTLQSIHPSL